MNPVRQQIRSMLQTEPRDGGFRAVLKFDGNLSILSDHFPNQPILPGICMLQAVLIAGAEARGVGELHIRHLKNSKLLQPVLPGDELQIDADMSANPDGDILLKARLSSANQKRAEFSMIARDGARP
jgi:3-hydroxymyristoyl/3-hydroxydecanoyl-(acyl carrier protein) dehydratase